MKISVWNSQWKLKKHQLSDWLSLSGEGKISARFNRRESDQVLYWTTSKFFIYSLSKQHVLKVVSFPRHMDRVTIHPAENLFLLTSGRILSIAELTEKESFIYQDYTQHSVSKYAGVYKTRKIGVHKTEHVCLKDH